MNGTSKVLISSFSSPKLAIFAKRCTRMATCIVNMCPEDPLFSWSTLKEEMKRLVEEGRGEEFVKDLAEINKDPNLSNRLVHFVSNLHVCVNCYSLDSPKMSYGTSAVHLDFGKEARIRTGEFFDIPSKHSQHEIVSPTLVSSLSFYPSYLS